LLFLAAALVFTSCAHDTDGGTPPAAQPNPAALVNAVYGGLNPGGAWVTVAFKVENKAVCAFSGDNTSNEYTYTYYDNRSGGLSAANEGGWTPGAFTLNEDGSKLTFTNFGGHGGEKIFNRLRKTDLTAEDSPSDLDALPLDLTGSVWGGSTPQNEGTGYLTLVFKTDNNVIAAFSADSTSNAWTYSYENGTGSIIATGWSPGDFTVSNGVLTFSNYGGHGGEKTFTRYYQSPTTESPAAPTPSVIAGNNQLTVTWQAVTGATSYEVYWHTADDTAAILAANKKVVTATSADITGLTNNTYYYVWVKAKNSKGTSDFSPAKGIMYPSIAKVWAFSNFAYLQKSDGTLWATGNNQYGQLGLGDSGADTNRTKFVQVKDASGAPITDVKKIDSVLNGVRLLKNDGTLWGVGRNANSARGDTDTANKSNFIPLTMEDGTTPMTGVSDIGGFLAIKDGELYVAGENNAAYKALGFERDGHQSGFVKVTTDINGDAINNVAAVFGTRTASFFVKTNGDVYACGSNTNGILGLGNTNTPVAKFTKVQGLTGVKDLQISGLTHVIVLKQDGSVWGAGNKDRSLGMDSSADKITTFTQFKWDDGTLITGIKEIAYSMLLKEDGTVWTPGEHDAGMNTIINPPKFIQVKDLFENILTGVSAIASPSGSTIYVLNDGQGLSAGSQGALGTGRNDIPATGLRLEDLDDLTPNLILFEE
jgi:alpha-tubulin suppressor-like RCC1 family protein